MYLDDVSVGGSVDNVLHDLDIIKEAESLGLTLNTSKYKVICHDDTVCVCGGGGQLSQVQR